MFIVCGLGVNRQLVAIGEAGAAYVCIDKADQAKAAPPEDDPAGWAVWSVWPLIVAEYQGSPEILRRCFCVGTVAECEIIIDRIIQCIQTGGKIEIL